jgi:hypothetical protein
MAGTLDTVPVVNTLVVERELGVVGIGWKTITVVILRVGDTAEGLLG